MKIQIRFRHFCLLSLLALAAGCKDPDEADKKPFDRPAMLQDLGNKVILPNYQHLQTEAGKLKTASDQFTASPDASTLAAVRTAFKDAYLAWQHVSAVEIGPAEQAMLQMELNTYPTDTTFILNKISANGAPAAYAEKGFPAIDYLLFSRKTDAAVLAQFNAEPNRKTYLQQLTSQVKTHADAMVTSWSPAGGNYLNTFVNASGTDVGSSAGQLVNRLNADLEMVKTNKLGIPLGKKTLGTPRPEKAEAYYSGYSNELAIENIKGIRNLYSGTDRQGTNHLGFDDYLNYLEAKSGDGRNLTEAIDAKVNSILAALQAIPAPISEAVITHQPTVEKAYEETRTSVVLFKTDMPSALGILITYQDNDGD